ncbi:MAG: hypothetical protein ACOYMA_20615 [Bacteroidia bacterium]
MKLFKNYTFLFLFIGISFHSFAQIKIEGFTKDDKSNSLAYVSFFCKNKFIGMSNEAGKFQFLVPDSLKFDTLKCKYLGYTPFVKSINEWNNSKEQTIVLIQKSIAMKDFIVKPKPQYTLGKVKFAGALSNKPKGIHYMKTGSIVGLLIKNEMRKIAFLKKAHFYIRSEGFPDTKFRVRVFEANKEGMPEKELLDCNYYGQGSTIGEEWVTVDLSNAVIQFPANGLVIAMEWLPIAENRITKKMIGNQETIYNGQCLGGTWEFDENYAFSYNNRWYKSYYPPEIKNFRKLNPMIKAEFDVVK